MTAYGWAISVLVVDVNDLMIIEMNRDEANMCNDRGQYCFGSTLVSMLLLVGLSEAMIRLKLIGDRNKNEFKGLLNLKSSHYLKNIPNTNNYYSEQWLKTRNNNAVQLHWAKKTRHQILF